MCQLNSWTTGEEFCRTALDCRNITETNGWTLSLHDDNECYELMGHDYVLDLISEMEIAPAFPVCKSFFLVTSDEASEEYSSQKRKCLTAASNNPDSIYNWYLDIRQSQKSKDRASLTHAIKGNNNLNMDLDNDEEEKVEADENGDDEARLESPYNQFSNMAYVKSNHSGAVYCNNIMTRKTNNGSTSSIEGVVGKECEASTNRVDDNNEYNQGGDVYGDDNGVEKEKNDEEDGDEDDESKFIYYSESSKKRAPTPPPPPLPPRTSKSYSKSNSNNNNLRKEKSKSKTKSKRKITANGSIRSTKKQKFRFRFEPNKSSLTKIVWKDNNHSDSETASVDSFSNLANKIKSNDPFDLSDDNDDNGDDDENIGRVQGNTRSTNHHHHNNHSNSNKKTKSSIKLIQINSNLNKKTIASKK